MAGADMVTPYFHVLAAHVCEQMIRLEALGKHIGHDVTHKHCSCSPCELANNRYNRTYFQRSSRRLTGLEEENLLTSWRCKVNRADIERTTVACGRCGKAFTRSGMLKNHSATCVQASKAYENYKNHSFTCAKGGPSRTMYQKSPYKKHVRMGAESGLNIYLAATHI